MDVKGGKLREGMARDDDAVEGILSHGCGHEAMPMPVSIARPSQRGRRDADRGVLTPYAACTALSAGSVLAALPSTFDLAVHTVYFCKHVFRPGLHLQIG
jgi:hypothetical protein